MKHSLRTYGSRCSIFRCSNRTELTIGDGPTISLMPICAKHAREMREALKQGLIELGLDPEPEIIAEQEPEIGQEQKPEKAPEPDGDPEQEPSGDPLIDEAQEAFGDLQPAESESQQVVQTARDLEALSMQELYAMIQQRNIKTKAKTKTGLIVAIESHLEGEDE